MDNDLPKISLPIYGKTVTCLDLRNEEYTDRLIYLAHKHYICFKTTEYAQPWRIVGDYILAIEFPLPREEVQLESNGAIIGYWNKVQRIEFPEPFLHRSRQLYINYKDRNQDDEIIIEWVTNKGGRPSTDIFEVPRLMSIPDDKDSFAKSRYGELIPAMSPNLFPKIHVQCLGQLIECIDIRHVRSPVKYNYLLDWMYSDYSTYFIDPLKTNDLNRIKKRGNMFKAIIFSAPTTNISLKFNGKLIGFWSKVKRIDFPEALPFVAPMWEINFDGQPNVNFEWLFINETIKERNWKNRIITMPDDNHTQINIYPLVKSKGL